MKSLLTLAIVLASTSAFATRARLTSLGNAPHLVDAASVYSKPADIFAVSDSVTIESGKTNLVPGVDTTDLGTEALMIRTAGDAKWALSLGHDDARSFGQRSAADTGSLVVIGQQNPLELTYGMKAGDIAWAGTLVYSNFNDKAGEIKESTTGLKFGAATSTWDATVDLGLTDKWESSTLNDEFKGKSNIAVRGGMWVSSDMYAYADVAMGGYEVTDAGVGTSEVKSTDITVGAINTMKNDGNEFFWGAGLNSALSKDDTADSKETSLSLPFIIGLEANAASWMTLRGSIQQNVLIQNEKTEAAGVTTAELSPGANSTLASIGAGLKLGKVALDGSLTGLTGTAQTQQVNANSLFGTVGLTYAF